ncbi:MAG: hypothetical protein WBP59_13415 [Ilumatobacteraceae bacterium]
MGQPVDRRGDPSDSASPTRWWALAALIPLGLFATSGAIAAGSLQTRLYFAGTPERWLAVVGSAGDLGDLRLAMGVDLAFASSFAVVGYLLMRTGLRHWAPDRRRRFGYWRVLPYTAVVAGVLDLVETSGQLIWLESTAPPSAVTLVIAVVAWWKWIAYIVALVGVFGLVIGPALAPILRPTLRGVFGSLDHGLGEPLRPDDPVGRDQRTGSVGICASGGGIRSSSVMIGAFRGLAADGTFERARWLHAVSGGGYTAAGWRVSSVAREETDLFGAKHPWYRSVRQRRRYLDNGWGALVGGVLGAIVRTVAVFGAVLSVAVVAGWVLGALVRTWAIHESFSNLDGGGATTWSDLTAWRLAIPGVVLLAVAVVALVVARTRSDEGFRRRADAIALVSGGVGLGLLALLVGAPIAIRYGRPTLESLIGQTAEANAGWLGLLSAIGVVTAVRQLLTSELKKRWSRLGGVALAFGLLLLAGKVADDRANMDGFFSAPWVLFAAVAWIVLLEIPPSHRLTLNGVYRKRLATTFCLGPGESVPLDPVGYADEPDWAAYRSSPGPELVLCGTSHSTRLQIGGLRALGFTFRPEGVTLHDGVSAPWSSYPSGSWWDGYPRGWIVSRSMALTGAAFASAMGRQSFGSTNALLAAVNLRLGMWVPNPRFPEWFVDRDTSPRVHLGYFAKELLNRYHPDRDPFVYVADGGHRENLGLVEQLREQPSLSIVLDASGDRPGAFTTLKQAVELAGIELGVEVDVDFGPIAPRPDDEPLDCVTTGLITYADGTTGRLINAKAQISDRTPVHIRQFAAAHPPFPDYSTGDQFLAAEEFDHLVELGEHLAERIAAIT